MKKIRSLSLVEFVVAVSVILVLVGLFIPARTSCDRTSRSIRCMNHLRQLGLAVKQYATDNHEQYPEGNDGTVSSHYRLLSNMVGNAGSIFTCPSDQEKIPVNTVVGMEDWNISYCYVRGLNDGFPIDAVLAFDRGLGETAADGYPLKYFAGQKWTSNSCHKGRGGNVLYCGAHVIFEPALPKTGIENDDTHIVEVP